MVGTVEKQKRKEWSSLSQNLEIEFKNMLTKEEYESVIKTFHIHESSIYTQENHYFDTADFDLKEKSSALRIRQKDGKFEMTLKQPCKEGLLETNQALTPGVLKISLQTICKIIPGWNRHLKDSKDIPLLSACQSM